MIIHNSCNHQLVQYILVAFITDLTANGTEFHLFTLKEVNNQMKSGFQENNIHMNEQQTE